MTDFSARLRYQLEMVLLGETKLLESAHNNNFEVERIEVEVKKLMERGIIFTDETAVNVMLAAYWLGRRMQFFASMGDLFGREELQKAYSEVCTKMGISPKQLN